VSARVVVGLDDSSHGRAALASAVEDAARTGATVDAILAYEGPQYWSEVYVDVVVPPEELQRQALQRARALVTDVVGGAPIERGEVAVRAVEGAPGSVLVQEAAGARLLVVGSRSRHSLEGLVLGSVALHCVTSAPCPVLVVRGLPKAPAAVAEQVRPAVVAPVG
jgi:nucleotide-binding universal stress UspA family protein